MGDNGHLVSLKDMSAQELLAEFHRTGKEEPFAEIVRRYAGMVYHVCLQVTKDVHDAEDATQAVFLTLAVRGKTAQKIKYLAPWLQRVGHRLSLDIRRSKKRRSWMCWSNGARARPASSITGACWGGWAGSVSGDRRSVSCPRSISPRSAVSC